MTKALAVGVCMADVPWRWGWIQNRPGMWSRLICVQAVRV